MPENLPAETHETSDVSARAASWFGLALAFSVVIIAFLIWRMEAHLDPKGPPWPHQPASANPKFHAPDPVLQTMPAEDLRVLRVAEDQALGSYGWIDRKTEVIRIPLERAKALILQRGLPATGTTMPLPGPQTNPPQGRTP